jgi:pentatricopeptide repeat protein
VEPSTVSFNSVLNALEKGGEPDLAVQCLQRMGRRAPPDANSYSCVISALAKGGGRWREALELLSQMEERHVQRPCGRMPPFIRSWRSGYRG